jgi:hypothetical protein
MATDKQQPARRLPRAVTTGALVIGLVGGSYGIATAAGGGSSTNSTGTQTTAQNSPGDNDGDGRGGGWGHQRSDEQSLTGDTLAGVTKAAQDKLPGATIVRVETDADGNAPYEAHVTRSDGTEATVYVDKQFNVVSVETR